MFKTGRFDNFVRGLDESERAWRNDHGSTPVGHAYSSPHEFVRQHGNWYEIDQLLVGMMPNLCYHNSILLALHEGWTYVEGYALVSPPFTGPSVVQHAWVVDPDGQACETTWPRPGHAYCGVVFSAERADNATWHGDATTLDDFQRGWPLLKQVWRGEDFSLSWEPSPAIEVMRREVIEIVSG